MYVAFIRTLVFALALFPALVSAQLAGGLMFPGPGTPVATATYQGPGDVVSGATVWGSCARVYNAAAASTSTSLCDLVDATTGTVAIGTLRGSSSGQVDLTAYFTGLVTPATACAAAAGGFCRVKKIYDQSGNSNHWIQATAANMPPLVFSAVNGLPGLSCTGSPVIIPTPALTRAQPFSMSTVYKRTSGSTNVAAIGAQSGGIIMGSAAVASDAIIGAGTNVVIASVPDNAFHAFQGALNGASGAYNIDGTDVSSQSVGANSFSASTLRLCSDGANYLVGQVMEGGMWPAAFTSGQRGNLNTNQHGSNGYNF
jgi:hypothetical protein